MFVLLLAINIIMAAQNQFVLHQLKKDIVELQDNANLPSDLNDDEEDDE